VGEKGVVRITDLQDGRRRVYLKEGRGGGLRGEIRAANRGKKYLTHIQGELRKGRGLRRKDVRDQEKTTGRNKEKADFTPERSKKG